MLLENPRRPESSRLSSRSSSGDSSPRRSRLCVSRQPTVMLPPAMTRARGRGATRRSDRAAGCDVSAVVAASTAATATSSCSSVMPPSLAPAADGVMPHSVASC